MRISTFSRNALVLFVAAASLPAQDVVTVKSPDGRIEFRLLDGPPAMDDSPLPHLSYQVDFKGKRLIDTSHLGFEIASQLPLGHKLGLMDTTRETVDETYTLVAGKAKVVRNHYNEVVAEYMQNGSLGRRMTMEVRAFDDGVAFRYVIAKTSSLLDFLVENEMTEFVFSQDADAYPLLLDGFQTAYEDQYSKLTLSGIHSDSLVGLPFLVEQPGVGWVAVTEADLDEYSGMYLEHKEGRMMKARLAPRVDGGGLAVQLKTPVVTPWRVLLISDRPEKLLESNIVTSLNLPSKISDTSWIKPGKVVWNGSATTAEAKRYLDFAAASGIEYVGIEGWSARMGNGYNDLTKPIPEFDMPAVLASAKQSNVGLWLSAPWRAVESQMDEAFALFEKWGVRGVRIDGMNRDDQTMVAFYRQAAAKAAEYHLLLDFHETSKPDGMERTFPNVLTREGVLGSEYSKWGARVTPQHNVMLAYTRLLAGSMDYAPGGFNNATRTEFQPREAKPMVLGTRAHQLALFVVFQSSLQSVADAPEAYKGEKDFDFIRTVPVTWDDSRGVAGEVGEYVAVARKAGVEWYLGAITNWTAREVDVPLAFLGRGEYIAEVYSDDVGTNPKHAVIEQRRVNASASMKLKLASGGGAAVRFRPVN
ncbi:MAG: glycoside hydrolase family 97 protein [Acidobacteriota bacterium]